MNEKKSDTITVNDFNNICRVCLKFEENMINIFESGINDQIMEITNVEIKQNDELPKTLCQNCKLQLHKIAEFILKAKSSELFLKSLLSTSSECEKKETHSKKRNFQKEMRRSKLTKKAKSNSDSEDIYLVTVNKPDDSKVESQICIKDLNFEYDNLDLRQDCKAIMENHIQDHSYLKDEKQDELLALNLLALKKEDKIVEVNLEIFKCSGCQERFEEFEEFTSHLLNHGIEESSMKNNYYCPVCIFSHDDKNIFFDHLKSHKCYKFVKVNSSGEMVPLKEDEKCIFSIPKLPINSSIFCLNLNNACCMMCHNIQSKDEIAEHMRLCLANDQPKFSIRYSCPVCEKSFIDGESNFIQHLSCHKRGNFFFIRVSSAQLVTQLKEVNDQSVYVLGESLESKIFEVVESNSCHKCNYVPERFSELLDHCELEHSEKISCEQFHCPVCGEHFQGGNVDVIKVLFYEHLKLHKNEVSFILRTKNGALANLKPEHTGIFTQSLVLWNLVNSTAVQNYMPDIIVPGCEGSADCSCETYEEKEEAHSKSQHMNYICEICGEEVMGKSGYVKHSMKHSRHSYGGKKATCSLCRKTFANKTTLKAHLKQHVREGVGGEFQNVLLELICEKCGENFSNSASLVKHKKLHLTGKENAALKCEICGRDFFKQSALDKHKSAHLNPKYFECSDCKLPIPSINGLQKHSEIHKNGSKTYDCKACELSFLTKDSLTAHQAHTAHYLGREPLECNVCHEKFFIGRKFAEHIKTHPKYKMGECTLCGKRLSTIQSLMIHMGRHFETNRILCPHCGKQFFEEKNYHRHLLTHEGIKPFACNVDSCKKSFYTLFELNRHKKYHNNTRDFKCSYCSKSFHEANHLTVHIRTHTGERPYACPHCNKGFATRTRCKHHIKSIHQGIGYDLIKTNISKKVTVFETVGVDL